MRETNFKKHVPLPKETKAYYCANCGAVALDPKNICDPQGRLKKIDWCGSKDLPPPRLCQNRVNNERYRCNNCDKVSVNAALLCEPEKMEMPE